MNLFRPTGLKDLQVARDAGWSARPAYRPDRSTFYPVTSQRSAEQIALDRTSVLPASDGPGPVTRFATSMDCAAGHPGHLAGSKEDDEPRVAADALSASKTKPVEPVSVALPYRSKQPTSSKKPMKRVEPR